MDLLISAVIPAVGSRFVAPRLEFPVSTLEAVLAFIGIYALLKIYRLWLYPTWLSPLRTLPGPKVGSILHTSVRPVGLYCLFLQNDTFLLGQAINLFKSIPPQEYIGWMRQWPDEPLIRFLDVGNREVVVVNSVKATKDVLQTHCYSFVKPDFLHRVLGEITGTGLLFAEGEHHKAQRRLLAGRCSWHCPLLDFIRMTSFSLARPLLLWNHQKLVAFLRNQSPGASKSDTHSCR